MNGTARVFSKEERELLKGIVRGTVKESNGIPIAGYGVSVKAILTSQGTFMDKADIYQTLHVTGNNQPFWRAVYQVVLSERPDLVAELLDNKGESGQIAPVLETA